MSKMAANYQISILLLDPISVNYDFNELAITIKKEISELGGSSPVMTPYNRGENLPPEVPRIIFQLPDLNVQVSSSRLDFNFVVKNPTNLITNLITSIENHIQSIERVLQVIEYSLPYRMGIVLNVKFDKENMLESLKKFIKEDIPAKNKEIQFSYLSNPLVTYAGSELMVNSWVRYTWNETQDQYFCVLDINTPVEKQFRLKQDKLIDIFEQAIKKEIEVSFCDC